MTKLPARVAGPAIAAAAAVAVTGWMLIDDGVRLSQLDLAGAPPSAIAVTGPDDVMVVEGDWLSIAVSGDPEAIDALRFERDDGTLAIERADTFRRVEGRALVTVTMPAPSRVLVTGPGRLELADLADRADVLITGTGGVTVQRLSAAKLKLAVTGPGPFEAAGNVGDLELSMSGSSRVRMERTEVATAAIHASGPGRAVLASNGKVAATLTGPGDIIVRGRATCRIIDQGPGQVRCGSAKPTLAGDASRRTLARPER